MFSRQGTRGNVFFKKKMHGVKLGLQERVGFQRMGKQRSCSLVSARRLTG